MNRQLLLNYKPLLWLVILFIMTSCAYKEDQALFKGAGEPVAPAVSDASADGTYRIRIGDVLTVKNMQQIKYIVSENTSGAAPAASDADNQTYQVEPDGTIGLPVIGDVKIAGITRFAAEQQIAQLYSKALIRNPIIQVRVVNLKVSVFGEVRVPGNYPLVQDQTSLTDILGAAGGLTDKADEKKVKIVRGDKLHQQSLEVDLSKLESLSDPSTLLQNGDIIYVPRNKRAIKNDHMQTFTTTIQPILIVLNTVLIIFTLSRK